MLQAIFNSSSVCVLWWH